MKTFENNGYRDSKETIEIIEEKSIHSRYLLYGRNPMLKNIFFSNNKY